MLSYELKEQKLYEMEWERDLLVKAIGQLEQYENTSIFTAVNQLEVLAAKIKHAKIELGIPEAV